MSTAVTLSIPDLLNPLRVKEANEALAALKLPALQTLLAKADAFASKKQNEFELSSYLFHQPKASAYASVMAAAELESYDPACYWLRVDPVQMIADRDSLVLIPSKDLGITEAESQALLDAFNQHFAQDKVMLEYASPQHWYLRIAQPVDLKTHSLASVAYQPVDYCYPTGNAATYWRKMINETQMLFFNHPVNEARREACLPEINSIWVWGEGQLTNAAVVERPTAMVWSDDVYLKGLATLSKARLAVSPNNFKSWKTALKTTEEGGGEKKIEFALNQISHHMIQLDPLSNALDSMEQSDWLAALKNLEKDWFEPLCQALRTGEIDSLFLELGAQSRYHLKPSHLKRFWRFKASLNKL